MVTDERNRIEFLAGCGRTIPQIAKELGRSPSTIRNELKRILQKGTSFDPLTQEQIALTLSHLNSYPRESLGWRTPYDVFVEKHGDEGRAFLAKLGIVRIPANQVTLHPFLLGQRFQRAADRAILHRNGVAPAPKAEAKK